MASYFAGLVWKYLRHLTRLVRVLDMTSNCVHSKILRHLTNHFLITNEPHVPGVFKARLSCCRARVRRDLRKRLQSIFRQSGDYVLALVPLFLFAAA